MQVRGNIHYTKRRENHILSSKTEQRGTQIWALRFLLPIGSKIVFIHHAAGKADRVDHQAQ